MSFPDIIFLSAVCAGYAVFMVTLGSVAWYCRDRLIETHHRAEPAPAKARVVAPPHS